MGLSRQLPVLQLPPMHAHCERYHRLLRDQSPVRVRAPAARRLSGPILSGSEAISHQVALVPGITNRYCGPSFETATEPVIGRAFARPVGDLLRMRSNSLKHNNLMLRSERRERLEAWAASDSQI